MASVLSGLGTAQYSAKTFTASTTPATSSAASATTSSSGNSGSNGRVVADTVELSPEAQAAAAQQQAATASTVKKSFAEVASDARSLLDQTYAQMKDEGTPFDPVYVTPEGFERAFGQLDRRSLFAVASNADGRFSTEEQDLAQTQMARQQGEAMGLYGPMGTNPSRDYAPGDAAGIRFLDSVSDEEKASTNWKVQRASMQWAYEEHFKDQHPGEEPEDFTIGDPLVNMLLKTYRAVAERSDYLAVTDGTYVNNLDELRSMPAFSDPQFAADLEDAIAASAQQSAATAG